MNKDKKEALRLLRVDAADGDIAAGAFAALFSGSPCKALGGSLETFKRVALGHVAKRAIKALTDKDSKATLETLLTWSSEEALKFTRSPTRSTSPTSNLWDQCVASGWARVAEILRRGF